MGKVLLVIRGLFFDIWIKGVFVFVVFVYDCLWRDELLKNIVFKICLEFVNL